MTGLVSRAKFAAGVLSLSLLVAGCSDGPPTTPQIPGTPDVPLDTLPQNSTPEGAVARLEACLEAGTYDAYRDLLTADFKFEFDPINDLYLSAKYPAGWAYGDEDTIFRRMSVGFRNALGDTILPVTHIAVGTRNTVPLDDPTHPDSAAYYRLGYIGAIDFETQDAGGGLLVYRCAAMQQLWLVRGNAAVLRPGQAATSEHWYIYKWQDNPQGTLVSSLAMPMPAVDTSLGQAKFRYRE